MKGNFEIKFSKKTFFSNCNDKQRIRKNSPKRRISQEPKEGKAGKKKEKEKEEEKEKEKETEEGKKEKEKETEMKAELCRVLTPILDPAIRANYLKLHAVELVGKLKLPLHDKLIELVKKENDQSTLRAIGIAMEQLGKTFSLLVMWIDRLDDLSIEVSYFSSFVSLFYYL